MILRRLGLAFARQDWSVVLIELLVLALGIFLGLRVDDWNQVRRDRADEQRFLATLHEDILLADRLSARVRERRLNRNSAVQAANELLFGNIDREQLSEEECSAVGSSGYFNIVVTGLPSLEELIATGRLGIIRDPELRTALMALRETRAALQDMVRIQTGQGSFTNLPQLFPELIVVKGYFADGEIRMAYECDTAGMRGSRKFLNYWGANADGYDAYVQDGLQPWSRQFDKVHAMVDQLLGLSHEP